MGFRQVFSFLVWFGSYVVVDAQARLPWLEEQGSTAEQLDEQLAVPSSVWNDIMHVGDSTTVHASATEITKLGRELVFGELTPKGIRQIIQTSDMDTQPSVFLDLGSGTSLAVVLVALLAPSVQRSIGLEYAHTRHTIGMERWKILHANSPELAQRIRVWQGNFLDPAWIPQLQEVTVVFSNSIMFGPDTQRGIQELITTQLPNVRFVISGIQFHEDCYHQHFDVSWGSDTFALWACDMRLLKR